LTPCTAPGLVVTRPSVTATFGSTFTNLSAFGQASANLLDRLKLIAGLRFTSDKLSVFHSRDAILAGPGISDDFDQGVYDEYVRLVAAGVSPVVAQNSAVAASNGVPFRTRTSHTNLSGKAGIQYDISDQVMSYATYARGYKGPAYNVFFNLSGTGTNVIEPETANSYEVGLKNALLGGRLTINLAAFYAKYKNYQSNNPDTIAGVVVTRFTNAGSISTRGVELDASYQPVRDLTISGGLAYTDAKVDQFKVPLNGNTASVIPNGTQLGAAIKWKGSLAADYRLRTGGALDFRFGTQISTQSSQGGRIPRMQPFVPRR
jgi:iron complex outermembrane receptor protein